MILIQFVLVVQGGTYINFGDKINYFSHGTVGSPDAVLFGDFLGELNEMCACVNMPVKNNDGVSMYLRLLGSLKVWYEQKKVTPEL